MGRLDGLIDFCEFLCSYQPRITHLFVLTTLGTILSVISLGYIDPGSGAYAVSILNLLALVPLMVVSGVMTWWCKGILHPE